MLLTTAITLILIGIVILSSKPATALITIRPIIIYLLVFWASMSIVSYLASNSTDTSISKPPCDSH